VENKINLLHFKTIYLNLLIQKLLGPRILHFVQIAHCERGEVNIPHGKAGILNNGLSRGCSESVPHSAGHEKSPQNCETTDEKPNKPEKQYLVLH
jgi:hypothetical protein